MGHECVGRVGPGRVGRVAHVSCGHETVLRLDVQVSWTRGLVVLRAETTHKLHSRVASGFASYDIDIGTKRSPTPLCQLLLKYIIIKLSLVTKKYGSQFE